MKRQIWILLLLLIVSAATSHAQTNVPSFNSYKTAVQRIDRIKINSRSNKTARLYRSNIRLQAETVGVNFAGHYALVTIPCKPDCMLGGIVDGFTGRVFFPKSLYYVFGLLDWSKDLIFQRDSRLLSINEYENRNQIGTTYYLWKKNTLRKVKFIPSK